MRLIKEGGRGYDFTEGVGKVAKEFECTPVEGQLSCNVRPHTFALPSGGQTGSKMEPRHACSVKEQC